MTKVIMAERTCRACGAVFMGGPRAWYCPVCRIERRRAKDREFKRRKKAGRVRDLGSIDLCVVCGKPYEVQGGLQKYCKDCAPEAIKAVDNAQGKAWIQANKATYYPAKNAARKRPPRHCRYCGKRLESPGISVCKSPECREKLKIKQDADREQSRAKYVDHDMAKQLKDARDATGKIARDFYAAIGVNALTVQAWRWETGKRPIPEKIITALEEKMGLKLRRKHEKA